MRTRAESLVEVTVPSRAAGTNQLQAEASPYGVNFSDHYLRHNANGSYTVNVLGTDADLAALEAAGYEITATIENEATWADRMAERQATIDAEARANVAALGTAGARRAGTAIQADTDEIVVLRVELLRELRRPLPLRRGEDASHGPDRQHVHRADALPVLEQGRGNADRRDAADDEPQHRPGHDARHVHRAPRVRPDRATASPTRPRSASARARARRRKRRSTCGSAAGCRRWARRSSRTSPRCTWTRRRSGRASPQLAAEFPNIATLVPLPNLTNGYRGGRRPRWPPTRRRSASRPLRAPRRSASAAPRASSPG